jgi:photosystem II stability/assembly factor-like uncharacterized protein
MEFRHEFHELKMMKNSILLMEFGHEFHELKMMKNSILLIREIRVKLKRNFYLTLKPFPIMRHSKTIIYFILTVAFAFSFLNSFAHFGSKGPYGGTVSCSIVYDSTVYIGTANSGVFESTTSKLVGWRARPVGLKSGKITALAHSGKDLYAATADSGFYIFNGYEGSDRYWKKINNGLATLKIKSLLAIDSVTLLAGTDGNGIFKSVNKGATWTAVANSTLNAAVITGFAKGGTHIFLTSSTNGVFISDDKGNTWTDFNDVNTLNITGTLSLSYNDATQELAVVNNNGIFRTAVSPVAAYTSITTGLPANTLFRSLSSNGSLWLLATDKGAFATSASTVSWNVISNGLSTLNVQTIVPFQNTLVAGTIGEGIFKANASTFSWIANNFGFNALATYSMSCSGIALVAAATEKGVFVSKDLANSYKRCNKGLTDSLNVTDITFWGSKLLAATKNMGVFISADSGNSWSMFNSALMAVNIRKLIPSLNYIYLFTDIGDVYQSQGNSWILIRNGLPSSVKPTALAFYGNTVALGTKGNGVYIKNVAAGNWQAFNQGLSNLNVTSMTSQGSKLFAGTEGSGVFVSDTAAADWKTTAPTTVPHTVLMGLEGKNIQAMATYGRYVFASYKGGLLATSDYGATWIAGGNQFNLPSYTDVTKVDFVTTRVFVTTENNGLYSNALSELPSGINEQASSIGTFNLYPNPSDGNFNMDLQGIKGVIKQVIVYDQEGRKVTSFLPRPSLTLQLHIPETPGMYYIQVITNEGTATQKIIIK